MLDQTQHLSGVFAYSQCWTVKQSIIWSDKGGGSRGVCEWCIEVVRWQRSALVH